MRRLPITIAARMLIGVGVLAVSALYPGLGTVAGAADSTTVITAAGALGSIAVAGPVLAAGPQVESESTWPSGAVELFARSPGGWCRAPRWPS